MIAGTEGRTPMRLAYVGDVSTDTLTSIGDANIVFTAIPFASGPPIGDIAARCPLLPTPLGERLRNRTPRKSRSLVGRPSLAFSQMTPALRSNPEAFCRSEVPSRPRLVTHLAARHLRTVWTRAWGVKGLARNWMPRPGEAPCSAWCGS